MYYRDVQLFKTQSVVDRVRVFRCGLVLARVVLCGVVVFGYPFIVTAYFAAMISAAYGASITLAQTRILLSELRILLPE